MPNNRSYNGRHYTPRSMDSLLEDIRERGLEISVDGRIEHGAYGEVAKAGWSAAAVSKRGLSQFGVGIGDIPWDALWDLINAVIIPHEGKEAEAGIPRSV